MDAYKEEAQKWNKDKGIEYELTFQVDSNKMTLKREGIFATINCPTDGDHISVWSESPELIPYLGDILNFCESGTKERMKTITEVLDRLHVTYNMIINKEEDMEDEEEYVDYYDAEMDNEEAETAVRPAAAAGSDEEEEDEETFFPAGCNPTAILRLKKDLESMKKEAHKFGIEGNPRGNNLFLWDVKLTGFSTDSKLGKDIQQFAVKYKIEPAVYLEMQFPGDFPMSPPFVRVTKPRFKFLTGHVTIGGSICMQMLTRSGWAPCNDIEGILVQIRSEIMSDPNARLDADPGREYTESEARDAFNRMVSRYGWNK